MATGFHSILPRIFARLKSTSLRRGAVAVACAAFGVAAFVAGQSYGAWSERTAPDREVQRLAAELAQQREAISAARFALDGQVGALAERAGQISARLVRLDALGERLTEVARLNRGEFDFSAPPAMGGPELAPTGEGPRVPTLDSMLDGLAAAVDDRSRQLGALEAQILARELTRQILPGGRPLIGGYVSSRFGDRLDPFTGEPGFHAGIDLAGAAGAEVMAVASGVVTFAGPDGGYGQMVEVTHGNGYVTRYAHNENLRVAVGDTVHKGMTIATIGSTGRSTGPHLHFEVLRNGAPVDPLSFLVGGR